MTDESRRIRGLEFIAKAERLARWLDDWLAEVREYGGRGRREDVERTYFSSIAGIGALQEAILSAASCWKLEQKKREILDARESNEVIRFFYHARNVELHNSVLKWRPNSHHVTTAWRVVDAVTHEALFWMYRHPLNPMSYDLAVMRFLFSCRSNAELKKRQADSPEPTPGRAKLAGIEIFYSIRGLILCDYRYTAAKGKTICVAAPKNNAADLCLEEAIQLHKTMLSEVREMGQAAAHARSAP